MKETFTITVRGQEVPYQVWSTDQGFSTNIAFKVAAVTGLPPLEVAKRIVEHIKKLEPEWFA